MGRSIKIIVVLLLQFQATTMLGAYLENVPIEVKQPDGTAIQLYATGDEYYNWTHDELGFTVVINPKTKYYCYATLKNGELIASSGIVGKCNPKKMGLKPGISLPADKIDEIQKAAYDYKQENDGENTMYNGAALKTVPKTRSSFQEINNIVIYVRFADQTEFTKSIYYYPDRFNNSATGVNSVYNYFKEASYNNLEVNSTFYPISNGSTIVSYQDIHESGYYMPINSCPIGYNGQTEKQSREDSLIIRAINGVKSQIPATLDIDNNNDSFVDNVCLIIRGNLTASYGLLWPHKGVLHPRAAYINGKRVFNYNIHIEQVIEEKGVGVICHEMNHSLGAPDLYHKIVQGSPCEPIGKWCLMAYDQNPPQHMCAYVKYRYNNWITEIPAITESGTYTLNPLTSATNNCFKIAIKGSTEFLVLEYRKRTGTFENSVYGSGMVVYRVNERKSGNKPNSDGIYEFGGKNDMIYAFRPNGSLQDEGNIEISFLSALSGRDSFNNNTNPYCFTSDGALGNIFIKNIKEINGCLTFDVRFCDGTDIVKSNTNNLPEVTNASNSIITQNTVVVKSTDNVIFEAANEVTLNPGFEVASGGVFEINMNGCGEK